MDSCTQAAAPPPLQPRPNIALIGTSHQSAYFVIIIHKSYTQSYFYQFSIKNGYILVSRIGRYDVNNKLPMVLGLNIQKGIYEIPSYS